MMERFRRSVGLLWLAAVVAMNTLAITQAKYQVVEGDKQVKNLQTSNTMQVIPLNSENSSVTSLVIQGSQITLSETDRQALASYSGLAELRLDGNLVTTIPAGYFSVVPNLKVLSLSRNNISSLDPESFSGLESLTDVDLSHNLLKSLHTKLFKQLNDLKVLNLEENPWNCSCSLLRSIGEIKAAGVIMGYKQDENTDENDPGGPQVTCASPGNLAGRDLLQVTAECYPSQPPTFTTNPQKPPTPVNFQLSWDSSTVLKNNLTSPNRVKDRRPVLGHSWKFTACVAALSLCTSMLIVCAIKGPSWYKLCHNYRHQRLQEEEVENNVSVFSNNGRYSNHQTFKFEQENGQIVDEDEDEDDYFEDPYIRREESHEGEEATEEP